MNDYNLKRYITLKDIAKALGLSRTAVAMALKNDRQIAESTRQKVQALAKEMGYQPNSMATNLAHLRQDSKHLPIRAAIAWLNLWPEPQMLRCYHEFDAYWKGAYACAEKFGYRLEEFYWNPTAPLGRLEEILIARGISGIVIPPTPQETQWDGFHWDHFSVVRLSRAPTLPKFHTITSDHVANAMMAVDAIAERGYQRIGFVTPQHPSERRWLYEAGYLMAQLEFKSSQRIPLFLDPFSDPKRLIRWLAKEKPDAILTPCRQLHSMLKQHGLRIPEDLALASMSSLDGNTDAGVDQTSYEIGRVGLLMLLSLIHENERGLPESHREILLKGRWVDGLSLPDRRQPKVEFCNQP